MKTSEFRKLIREEIRKVLKEVGEADPFAWSNKNDADKLPAKVILSSDYEGDWEDDAPEDWFDDFEAVQNQLAKKFVDGKDFGVMMGMGDDIFNALFVVNPAVLQDPVIKKYIKKIMSYGGLEIEKGKISETRKKKSLKEVNTNIDPTLLNKFQMALKARMRNPEDENAHDAVEAVLTAIFKKAGVIDAEDMAAGAMEDEVFMSGPYNAAVSTIKDMLSDGDDWEPMFTKGLKEVGTPQEKAIKLAVQTALDNGDDDELYDNSSPISYKNLSKKAGLSDVELQHVVMYCLDAAGEDVPGMDNLDAKAAGGGGLTGFQMMDKVKKKLKGMGIDIDSLV